MEIVSLSIFIQSSPRRFEVLVGGVAKYFGTWVPVPLIYITDFFSIFSKENKNQFKKNRAEKLNS